MLTENRREYLKKRGESDKGKRVEYDYRVLKWLEAMLDSSDRGGIGDINRVLDTLDRDAVTKHLKDENVFNLLNLVVRLLDTLNFAPIEQTTRGQSIVACPNPKSNEPGSEYVRRANDADYERNLRLFNFANILKQYYADPANSPQLTGAMYIKAVETAEKLGHMAPSEATDTKEGFKKKFNMINEPK